MICTLHCRTALPPGFSLRFMISFEFQVAHHMSKCLHLGPSWTTSLRQWHQSNQSAKMPQKKKTDMDDLHEAPENGRLAGWPKRAGSQVE